MSDSFAELSPYTAKSISKASDTVSAKQLESIGYTGEKKGDSMDVSCGSVERVWTPD